MTLDLELEAPVVPARPKRRANALQGKEWLRNSVSVWSDIQKTDEERSFTKRMKQAGIHHPAMFPTELARRVIRCFAPGPEGTVAAVLDPFCGTGSTLLAATQEGHVGLGIDVAPEYLELAASRLPEREPKTESRYNWSTFRGSAGQASGILTGESVDLVFTSPPYWDILSQRRTSDLKGVRDYISNTLEGGDAYSGDLSGIASYEEFVTALAGMFNRSVFPTLKPGGYCVVNVMDLRKRERFFPLHSDLATALSDPELGGRYIYDDLIVWDRRHEYNCLRPLGYPAVFRVNKCHEYLLIFQRPRQ